MEKLLITGHIGQDAQIRQVGEDTVANFSVAVTHRTKKDGQAATETTNWYNCALWRPSKVVDYLKKGQPVLVEGRPQARIFTKKDNTPGIELGITVTHVELMGKNPNTPAAATTNPTDPFSAAVPQTEEDLPY